MNPELLGLPWATLLTLAAGYAGYWVANVGVREHHKEVDIAFSTLVFGFLASGVYFSVKYILEFNIAVASAASFLGSGVIGAIWRKWGRPALVWVLKNLDIAHSSDYPSAWISLFDITGIEATQLHVKLVDGSWLKCEDLSRFGNEPNGPCTLGGDGDILMFVTDRMGPDDQEFKSNDLQTAAPWGTEITYIPASQIARVDLRRVKKGAISS